MDTKIDTFISIIITAFNEGDSLDRILNDISMQDYSEDALEVLLLEAGSYSIDRVKKNLSKKSNLLRYWNIKGLSRTHSLNKLVNESKGDLIVRLDARTHILPDYLKKIAALSQKTKATNVGGVKIPIGKSSNQNIISKLMSHRLCFGGGKFRNQQFSGPAETVYLGAFFKKTMPPTPWFEEIHTKISEDSDLNYRIRKYGGQVFVDSDIQVYYYPHETLKNFFKLCFNYGIGRGLFIFKHRRISALRQLVIPFLFLIGIIFFVLGFLFPILNSILFAGSLLYITLIVVFSWRISNGRLKEKSKYFCGFIGCHIFWLFGLLSSFRIYRIAKK